MPKLSAQVLIALVTCSLTSAPAYPHDLVGLVKQELGSAVEALEAARSATPTADQATRSVLANFFLWPVPRRLTVCFLQGAPEIRHAVVDSMRRSWDLGRLTEGRLDFNSTEMDTVPDCNPSAQADIRIDFRDGEGYWSYVGVESLAHSPSMNFGGFTKQLPASGELDRLVGHETGHALGLEHEHQSPAAPDCMWDFDYIFTHYVWSSRDDMMNNFAKLQDYLQNGRHAYIFSLYDQKSIMHYSFEPAAFKAGGQSPCFIAQNYVPSDQDKNAISVAYGPSAVDSQRKTRDLLPQLGQTFSDPKYQKLRDLLTIKGQLLQ